MTKLEELLSCLQNNHVYIQTHSFPDPDAIACAYGLKQILAQKKIDSTICYSGRIDRFNTLKMLDLLDIQITPVEEILEIVPTDDVILIDAQAGNINVHKIADSKLFCIDHHPIYENANYLFSDIRPEVGSCSSIIANYYYENSIPLDARTATALIYGLKIDTANLSRGVGKLDLNMFYHLYIECDHALLKTLDSNTLQFQDLKAYANAINTIHIEKDISFANAGPECQDALIATISDFLISLVNVHLSIVYSIKKEGIKISIRSKYSHYDSGKICNLALSSIGNGGGHASMAGGFVPFTEDLKNNELLIQEFEPRFLQAIHTLYEC